MSVHQEYDHPEERRRGSATHTARLVLGAILLVVVVAIVIDNRHDTTVGYVFGDVRAPLVVVLLGAAVVGALVGWLLLHRPHHER
jgi:uncharacterized integral membrane protein